MKTLFALVISFSFLSCKSDKNKQEEGEWLLDTHYTYSYVYTKEGFADTVKVKTVKYKDLKIADSVQMIQVYTYNNLGKPVEKKEFSISKMGNYEISANTAYGYDSKGNLVYLKNEKNGSLTSLEKHTYDTANRKIGSMVISLKPNQTNLYDTMVTTFAYDPGNKLLNSETKDNRGNTQYKFVSLYTGEMPAASYVIRPNGDTTQVTKYNKEDQLQKETITVGDVIINRWHYNGYDIQIISENVKTKENSRNVFQYNDKGQLLESKTFIYKFN